MEIKEAVKTIYNERSKFIVIGLTGRTGSGCSETAKILGSDFENLKLRVPKNSDFKSREELKDKIIYNYAKYNWQKFTTLKMVDVIFSFILQYELDELDDIFKEMVENWDKDIIKELKDKKEFTNMYKETYDKLKGVLNENKTLKRENIDYLKKEYEIIGNITKLHNEFKNISMNKSCEIKIKNGDKEVLSTVNLYTALWQEVANRIRKYGDIKVTDIKSENMFHLARRANDFIKAIRKSNSEKNDNTLICIDAFRNPYEAQYFKDRYSAFYLISVNTDDIERRRRLGNLTNEQIDNLDFCEYPKKLKGLDKFTNQNIAECIELSDIHIHNPYSSINEKFYLTYQLVKYVVLMKHPGLITPTHIERCMQIAYNAKLNSGCLSRQVGAAITDENYSIKSIGWNEVPEGQIPCNLREINDLHFNKNYDIFSDFEVEDEKFSSNIENKCEKIKKIDLDGRFYQYCFKDVYTEIKGEKNQVHTRALHAEENAFLQLVKYGGLGIKGGNLFTTASPCELCSKKAYQLGIRNIYYIDPYPGISVKHILSFKNRKGDEIKTHLFVGAIGQAYTLLYSQKLSIKDELELLTE